ncbi:MULTISPECIES: hypothetical protein [Calothrix]|uniref:Uncharacterized protein n=2 Tax=Calothrix TaxID=1186 RepID=A0ABR8AAV1_9CYAN|nr:MULTISPECIES: hypothetical protein [Calothrix]MBD2195892.1 hypothetical protein [Calothrix parietina FACHB-288]MBD2227606.1 hypothetical protein [Calothrix anomala FACHB-343]
MQVLSNKTDELLTHTLTDTSKGNTITYTWNSMWSHHICPCCSYALLRHMGHTGIYWRCSHCYQEMPLGEISNSRTNYPNSAPVLEF